jgi:hypothetical protein
MADRTVKVEIKAKGDANGVADGNVLDRLLADPTRMRVGIVIFNAPKIETDLEADTEVVKVRIHRIEAILDDDKGDASAIQRVLTRATERRAGVTTLDASLEDDVRAAFDGIALSDFDDPAGGSSLNREDQD